MTQGSVFLDEQFDLLILIVALVAIGSFALVGRDDLGVRIPNVLDMVVGLLVIDRLFGVLAGGELPIPTMTNPLEFEASSWTIPVIGNEILLILAALLWNWVEGERQKRGLQDHRGAMGRIAYGISILLLSFTSSLVGIDVDVPTWLAMEATRCPDGWIHRPAHCSQRIGVVGRSRVEPHLVRSVDVVDGHRYAWLLAGGVATYANQGLWISASLWVAQILFVLTGVLSPSLLLFVLLTWPCPRRRG